MKDFSDTLRFGTVAAAAIVFASLGGLDSAHAARSGHFTHKQVKAGHTVFSGHCAECHGSKLQGGAGPALHGSQFESNLKFGNMSAKQLYDFIAQHMPKTDPGSLSKSQYLDVFAYILSQNGFSTGSKPLAKDAINKIKLLPLPSSGKKSAGQSG